MGTCDPQAPVKWFRHFKSLYRWDLIHTDQIEANFKKKAGKILHDTWRGLQIGKTKDPKWLTKDHIYAGRARFNTDPSFIARSEKNRQTYAALLARNGPYLLHAFGSRPAHFHLAKLEKDNQRQVLPIDILDKKYKRKDGTYMIHDGENKRKQLADAQDLVLKDRVTMKGYRMKSW